MNISPYKNGIIFIRKWDYIYRNQNLYNISITLHGFRMIFFLVLPGLFGGLGIILHLSFKDLQKWYILESIFFSIVIILLSYFS